MAAWLILRLITLAGAWYSSTNLVPGPNVEVAGYATPELTGPVAELVRPWLRADALWYLKISTQGYRPDDGTLAFFPALPAVVWALDSVMGNEAWAGVLAANLATLAGLIMLFAFLARAVHAQAAKAAVVGFVLFPTAFFLMAPYGESMLLMSGAGALFAAQVGRHRWSFVAGVVAGISRPFGAAIALPVAAIVAARSSGKQRWLAPAGPIVGLALWGTYMWQLTGDPLALVHVQGTWQRVPQAFWNTLWAGFQFAERYAGSEFAGYAQFDLAAALFGLALVPAIFFTLRRNGAESRWLGGALAAYGLATLAIPLSLPFLPRPLLSVPRFVLALFPLFAGMVLLPRGFRWALAVASAAGLFIGTAVFLAGRPLF